LVLRLDGAGIGFASNYAEVLRVLQIQPPDFLLLDLKTSESDGLNLLRQLKHHPPLTPVFTLALAPGGDQTPILRAFDLGLVEFVQTPFETSLLRARLRALLQLKQRMAELV